MTATSRKEKAAETETALKEAAKRVFAARGYLNTKITDITTEAGRAAGSFYNHFASKEELLEGLLADLSATGDETAEEQGHLSDFTDPEAVRWHVRAYWSFYRENAATMLAIRQAAMVNDEFARKLARFGAAEQADLGGHLEHITRAGLRLPATPPLSIVMMYELVDSFARMWLVGDRPEGWTPPTDDEAIEALTRFVYRGFTGLDY
ncbi:TetR/AcrR family transcriptional regulator [Amycolatopsis sp. H20-H5]|uniref:TetR/AcrR family transcriptional regulator n=1 Tax=Amycolatopsis sp. H20-H5 TaxID=3046309 RepID=UPI002DBF4A0D|nr:TetR/AcrR family transcriptional regulator [Amycolatopsis sp. H20-H5]MEC3979746.1 TetR/AcrR family transcriptional regulator [Amycolatopsis sp. H20-H5]